MDLIIDDIRRRWQYAWEAKQDEMDRIEKGYLWLYEFERHLRFGEEGDEAYRFPEIYGYGARRFDNYMKAMPDTRVKGSGEAGLQASIDKVKIDSNLKREKQNAIWASAYFGNGCVFTAPKVWERKYRDGSKKIAYRGLTAENIPWLDMFPAPGYTNLHDHTGQSFCPYMFRRKVYHFDTFKRVFSGGKYTNIDKVQPTTWGNSNLWGDIDFNTPHKHEEATASPEFVTIIEYWDVENDYYNIYASGGIQIYMSPVGVPYSHKMLPFSQYRNRKRDDSINGIGEIEFNMGYNLIREKTLNLGIKGMLLSVQPAMVVDGDIGFNTEEQEVEPGAVFNVKGIPGGKLQDHIMPFQVPSGLSGDTFQMIQTIENSRISATGDDTTALYSNPNQLATQTLAKMESLNKSIDSAVQLNLYDTEFYMATQIVSLIKNEFSKPYKNGKKTVRTPITVNGYNVIQDGMDADVKFVKGHGASGTFYLNEKTADLFEGASIEVISARKDEELKRDRTEKLVTFTNTILTTVQSLAQTQPEMITEVLGGMDVAEWMRVMAKNLGLESELMDIFPAVEKEDFELNAIAAEHDQIMAGITPPIRPDENSLEELPMHLEFAESTFFKNNATKAAKKALNEHIILTMENAQKQNAKPVADRQAELEQSKEGIGKPSVQGANPVVEGTPEGGGAKDSLQATREGMEQGVRDRAAGTV